MTPRAAKKYKEERKKADARARERKAFHDKARSEAFKRFRKRQDRCFEKGGFFIPTKDTMGRTRYKCDESKNEAKKARARAEKLETQYKNKRTACLKIRSKILNKGYDVERIDKKIKRLEEKKKVARDYISKKKKDEEKCIEGMMRMFKKFSKASELASSLESKSKKDKKKAPSKKSETKKDPCAELRSIKFSRKRDCKGKGYRRMMLRVHPDKNRECIDLATKRTQELLGFCRK